MANIQNYVERNNSYISNLTFAGADADQIIGVYQVYISAMHEWGTPTFEHSQLYKESGVGDTVIVVDDGTDFAANDHIVLWSGNIEYATIFSKNGNELTLLVPLVYSHSINSFVSKERLATRTSANNYTYTISAANLYSSGAYKIKWRYIQSTISKTVDQSINVYQPYISQQEFFTIYTELSNDFDTKFSHFERLARDIINTICGQSFDYYENKILSFDGTGKDKLYLYTRIEDILEATLLPNTDITEIVRVDTSSSFFIVIPDDWNMDSIYSIRGNWGWSIVPRNITEAAGILVADLMNDDSAYPQHHVAEVYYDTHRLRFDDSAFFGSGNLEVDTLLMDYIIFTMEMI
jgi:hypothetical protein